MYKRLTFKIIQCKEELNIPILVVNDFKIEGREVQTVLLPRD